jgi:hypothetical protein
MDDRVWNRWSCWGVSIFQFLERMPDRQAVELVKYHLGWKLIATEYSLAIGRLGLPTVLIGEPVPGIDCVNADDTAGEPCWRLIC